MDVGSCVASPLDEDDKESVLLWFRGSGCAAKAAKARAATPSFLMNSSSILASLSVETVLA
jgi:hypothetical protein